MYKQTEVMDVGAAVLGGILAAFKGWEGAYTLVGEKVTEELILKAVEPEKRHLFDLYDDGCSGVQLVEVYVRSTNEEHPKVPGVERLDTFPNEIWMAWGWHPTPSHQFQAIPLDETWYYDPALQGVLVFGALDSATKEMRLMRFPITFDCTRDNVVKHRPETMSETQAYKLLPKWKGRCTLQEAASRLWHLHADTTHLPYTETDEEDESDFPFETGDQDNG